MANGEIENVKSLLVHHTEHGTVSAKIIKISGRLYVGLSRVLTPKDNNGTTQSKGVYFPLFAWKRFLEILPELDEAVKDLTKQEQESSDEAHKKALSMLKERAKPLATSTPKKEVSNETGRTSIEDITKNWYSRENVSPATRALFQNGQEPAPKQLKRKTFDCGTCHFVVILHFARIFTLL